MTAPKSKLEGAPREVDPTRASHWRPLRLLLRDMDDDLALLYAERGVGGIRPRFALPLIRLHHTGPLSIRQLADSVEVSHSAMSQTVSAMRRADLVRTTAGTDARTSLVDLTDSARDAVPFLEAEWRATEEAVAELDGEIPYALAHVVRDLESALASRTFHDRVLDQLSTTRWRT